MDMLERIDTLASSESATVGVYFKRMDNGETIEYNASRVFPAASVIKVPIMMEVFNQESQGLFHFDDVLSVSEDTGGPRGSGILKYLKLPVDLSVWNLCTLMIIISDNTASNRLIDLVGADRVTRFCKTLGASDIVLRRHFIGSGIDDISKDNTVTAKALGLILEKLYNREIVSQRASEDMIGIMKKQQVNHKIPRYLPTDMAIAHKTGTQDITSHDAGIVFNREGCDYIVCICCTGVPSHPNGDDIVAKISRMLYEHSVDAPRKEV